MTSPQSNAVPLHQMAPCERFSDRALDYAQYRPTYPTEALDVLLAGLIDPSLLTIADVGAGTGIASRLLGDRGATVWAIEPNAAMQQAAISHLNVTLKSGTAEQTGLPDGAVDLVTCFQSFHWFNPDHCLPEFHRILKPGGRLALVWNDRDQDDAFTAHYSELVRAVSNHHPAEKQRLALASDALATCPLFQSFRQTTVPSQQQADLAGLLGRARSTSYVPREGPAFDQFVVDLTDLHAQWADPSGFVTLVYSTNIFLAEAALR